MKLDSFQVKLSIPELGSINPTSLNKTGSSFISKVKKFKIEEGFDALTMRNTSQDLKAKPSVKVELRKA